MKQEDKELLLKDLSARLPYGVKISVNNNIEKIDGISVLDNVIEYGSFLSCDVEEVKPYLFPMSSMTVKQRDSYRFLTSSAHASPTGLIEFFHKNHIDYRGLISKGLANDATGLNIY